MAAEERIVLVQGQPPIRAGKLRYDYDSEFSGFFDENPMTRKK
jgi:type IV secretory pathway TraG/TraD family ATPase VirD4